MLVTILFATCVVLIGLAIAKVVNWVWLRPRKLERYLRSQGLNGTPYRILYGDLKESSEMMKEARSKPIGLDDDISPRVVPLVLHSLNNNGAFFFLLISKLFFADYF